ncbi:Fur family transcriptional regulator [Streptomyces sp. NPDC091281]|uniref:Fur family transcriptional regulator n=1 Tax=Streptomyces sp. NPDC091281 TaxID=3365985 RepID=UPI0037F16A92
MGRTATGEHPSPWRSTRQRAAILQALLNSGDFVSARQLHAELASVGFLVGLTTVYRTLRMLEQEGHVDVVREQSGERLYRPRPSDGHRHYLVCRKCGISLTVDAEAVENWAEAMTRKTGFSDIEHVVELTGICDHCRRPAAETASETVPEPRPREGDRARPREDGHG